MIKFVHSQHTLQVCYQVMFLLKHVTCSQNLGFISSLIQIVLHIFYITNITMLCVVEHYVHLKIFTINFCKSDTCSYLHTAQVPATSVQRNTDSNYSNKCIDVINQGLLQYTDKHLKSLTSYNAVRTLKSFHVDFIFPLLNCHIVVAV